MAESFKQNLKKKIETDRLTRRVLASLVPSENGTHLDNQAMAALLESAGYKSRTERETRMWSRDFDADTPEIIVLDNELAFYKTHVADVLLRKNPTLKEMVSIKNAIKILNDKDVVVSRKIETVMHIHAQCMQKLNLEFDRKDISEICQQGIAGLNSEQAGEVIEALELLAELLDLRTATGSFPMPGILIWGKRIADKNSKPIFGNPLIIFFRNESRLLLLHKAVSAPAAALVKEIENIASGQTEPDLEGNEVFDWLGRQVFDNRPADKSIDSFSPE